MKPILTGKDIILRIITLALEGVGCSEVNAHILAEVHLEHVDHRLERWSTWLSSNCLRCKLTPETCTFLNPEDNTEDNVSKEDIKESHLRFVEMEWDQCPLGEFPE